jgi:hypothetical protein
MSEGWAIHCEERTGLLVPRPCRKPALNQCALCRKPVCEEHTVRMPAGEIACTACAAQREVGPRAPQYHYWDYYGYDDRYYRWHGSPGVGYGAGDYAAFDQPGADPGVTEQLEGS